MYFGCAEKNIMKFMGQQISNTNLYNEYKHTFVETVKKINDKLPMVNADINRQRDYFKKLVDTLSTESSRNYVVLETGNQPVPYSKNLYRKMSDIGSNSADQKIKNWALDMLSIFDRMLYFIHAYGRQIDQIYVFTDRNTFPVIQNILKDYADYIFRCYEFATSTKTDFFSEEKNYINLWKQKETQLFSAMDRNIKNVTSANVQQVVIRADMPPQPMVTFEPPPPVIIPPVMSPDASLPELLTNSQKNRHNTEIVGKLNQTSALKSNSGSSDNVPYPKVVQLVKNNTNAQVVGNLSHPSEQRSNSGNSENVIPYPPVPNPIINHTSAKVVSNIKNLPAVSVPHSNGPSSVEKNQTSAAGRGKNNYHYTTTEFADLPFFLRQ